MKPSDEIAYLGRLISLLAKHEQLTLGEIKNKTRAFLRRRHQTDSSLFFLLEKFVEEGKLKRTLHQTRSKYAIADGLLSKPLVAEKKDLLEAGLDKSAAPNELVLSLANAALKSRGKLELPKREDFKQYVPKEPPPSDVKGFK